MDKKKATFAGSLEREETQGHSTTGTPIQSTDKYTQRAHIIKMLQHKPQSTFDFRAAGICAPAPRISELKQQGYNIVRRDETLADAAGVVHRGIAVYTLLDMKEVQA